MRTRVRSLRRWRMVSWPAAIGDEMREAFEGGRVAVAHDLLDGIR